MSVPERVEDPNDPRVVDYVALSDPDHRRAGDVFIAEGEIALRRVLGAGATLRSLLVSEKKLDRVRDLAGDHPTYVAAQRVLDAVVGYHLHRGVVAAVHRPPSRDVESLLGPARVAVLENLTDHENVGVIFRSAAALGVGAIFLSPSCCDPYYRRSVRVSQGNVAAVPFATIEAWPAGLRMLKERGYVVVALTPKGDVSLRDAGLAAHDRVAMLVGTEGDGLSTDALASADLRVSIPMQPGVDSLNVATAAAIAFYEAAPPMPRDRPALPELGG